LRIILAGTIGGSGTGGQTWANLHYLLGLRALGHDVYYLEDMGDESYTYDWQAQVITTALDYPASYVARALGEYGFGDKWIYRTTNEARGMSLEQLRDLCGSADLLIIRGVPLPVWRAEYDLPRMRAFIDVDPGFTQIRLANQESALVENCDRCEVLFTYAVRIGRRDCSIPKLDRQWHPTVPPIDLKSWSDLPPQPKQPLTTIIRWRGVYDVEYNGVNYGQRDTEFPAFFNLPRATGQHFRLALIGGGREQLEKHGWEVQDGGEVTRDFALYRKFIAESRGEFGVAKQCYVDTRGGWFSDRSASYLAAGRPVVLQDTGIGDWLSVGQGVFTFKTYDDAVATVNELQAKYDSHAANARAVAEEYFAADRVLAKFLDKALE
jgi:hypothetical protein